MRFGLVLLVSLSGCGTLFSGFKEYCEDRSDCLDVNDEDEKACIADVQNTRRVAKIYDCEDDYMDYMECMKEDANCESQGRYDYWTDEGDCTNDLEDYLDCVSDESDLGISNGAMNSTIQPCDQYVEYLCQCYEEECDSLRTTYANADQDIQDECAAQLEDAAAWAQECSDGAWEAEEEEDAESWAPTR